MDSVKNFSLQRIREKVVIKLKHIDQNIEERVSKIVMRIEKGYDKIL